MKVAFLDRDGTINKDYPDEKWTKVKKFEILEGTIKGLKYLKNKGFEFIIVTNQYIIEEGFITFQDYINFNENLLKILGDNSIGVIDIFYCPHSRDVNCSCIKPKPGLIQKALDKYPSIDMASSILIGDSLCDKELADYFRLDFYGIN